MKYQIPNEIPSLFGNESKVAPCSGTFQYATICIFIHIYVKNQKQVIESLEFETWQPETMTNAVLS